MAVALALLLLLECVRYHDVLGGHRIGQFMHRFTDQRESGPGCIIRTHLYLLAGCALPLWHANRLPHALPWSAVAVAACSGTVVLGMALAHCGGGDGVPLAAAGGEG